VITQPKALRLAKIQSREWPTPCPTERDQTAAELRRLHAVNQELLAALVYLTAYAQQHGVMPAALTTARAAIAKGEAK
jgi:hypothetical protein